VNHFLVSLLSLVDEDECKRTRETNDVSMVGFRSTTMALCLRSMMAARLRSMMACSELESRTVVSSGAKVKDDSGVLVVDGCML
jgi:hypothetical protein